MLTIFVSTAAGAADGPCIVPGRGHFQIHVGTAGVFSFFAHEHLIEAQKIDGCASIDPAGLDHSSIKLAFNAASLRVLDPKESASDRAEIQKTMETEVLRIAEYPNITFESASVENSGSANELRVRGNLTIRGKMQPIVIPVRWIMQPDGSYRATGKYSFKQTSFGIQPITRAGGTVRVKDEVQGEFELFLK